MEKLQEVVEIVPPLFFLEEYLTPLGKIAGRDPSPQEWEDISYGARIARFLADEEIGQTVVVKRGTVLALEGAEGTDETIKREFSGERKSSGGKSGSKSTELLIDVPAIGEETVRHLQKGNNCFRGRKNFPSGPKK